MDEPVAREASAATSSPSHPSHVDRSDHARGDPMRLRQRLSEAVSRGVDRLLAEQHEDGHWRAELEGDSILQSEYVLMKWILGQEDDPRLPAIVRYLRRQQTPEGIWTQYPGGGIDVSATTKAYLVLQLAGDDPEAEHMRKCREAILAAGGAERCNTFSKFYFACLGLLPYAAVPSIPAELIFLPKWFYFHLDKVSSWSRAMIVTLAVVVSSRKVRELPRGENGQPIRIDELFRDPASMGQLRSTNDRPHRFWTPFFRLTDRLLLKNLDRLGMTPWRKAAIRRLEQWVLDHTTQPGGLGAIFPPIVYQQIAFQTCLGYEEDHPVLRSAREELDAYMLRTEDEHGEALIHLQPCFSPVWDTGIATYALVNAGYDRSHPALKRAADWLVAKECTLTGADYQNNLPQPIEPAGWFFEYDNPFYPDNDDTAMVAMALKNVGGQAAIAAAERGVAWVLHMQNPDGGWAAFDVQCCNRSVYEFVPFADHNAIQDPSCPDITGRVLECLGHFGYRHEHPAVARAIAYIKGQQHADGSFFGRWGVNFLYGTWQSVGGLDRLGYDMSEPWIQKAGEWVKSVQKPDGSFGESCDSYEDESLKGQGESTASQTAWAAMTLLAIFGPHDPATQRAIQWLAETQREDGGWHEEPYTGTGFPRVFYLRYHLYKLYFPVMAIGRWAQAVADEQASAA